MWYNKYCGYRYKHLGEDINTGIDCFNLIKHIYKCERDISIPYSTKDFCLNSNDNWYSEDTKEIFLLQANIKNGWKSVNIAKPFDMILLSIGSTNIVNHCALCVEHNKILHIDINHLSHIAFYGKYYKQYTSRICRWIGI